MSDILYENQEYAFSISYPSNWEVGKGIMSSIVIFHSPVNEKRAIRGNLNVVIVDLSDEPTTLEQSYDPIIAQLENVITMFKLINKSPSVISGNDSYEIIFTGIQGKHELKWMQNWTISDNMIYTITYTNSQLHFDEFLDEAKKMINTFKIH
jgi:hypothetical protein